MRKIVSILLVASLIILAPMIPGGPIENRTFPDMPIAVATAYNILITVVGLATIPLAFLAYRGGRLALYAALADALGFIGIYGLDLAHVFPGGPPMGAKVTVFESAGLVVALALAVFAIGALRTPGAEATLPRLSLARVSLFIGAALVIGLGAVYFGTIHALG